MKSSRYFVFTKPSQVIYYRTTDDVLLAKFYPLGYDAESSELLVTCLYSNNREYWRVNDEYIITEASMLYTTKENGDLDIDILSFDSKAQSEVRKFTSQEVLTNEQVSEAKIIGLEENEVDYLKTLLQNEVEASTKEIKGIESAEITFSANQYILVHEKERLKLASSILAVL